MSGPPPTWPCCASMAHSLEIETDAEGWASALTVCSDGRVAMLARVDDLRFCPWCGISLAAGAEERARLQQAPKPLAKPFKSVDDIIDEIRQCRQSRNDQLPSERQIICELKLHWQFGLVLSLASDTGVVGSELTTHAILQSPQICDEGPGNDHPVLVENVEPMDGMQCIIPTSIGFEGSDFTDDGLARDIQFSVRNLLVEPPLIFGEGPLHLAEVTVADFGPIPHHESEDHKVKGSPEIVDCISNEQRKFLWWVSPYAKHSGNPAGFCLLVRDNFEGASVQVSCEESFNAINVPPGALDLQSWPAKGVLS